MTDIRVIVPTAIRAVSGVSHTASPGLGSLLFAGSAPTASVLSGGTIVADSASQADVAAAISSASNGDTILIPSGTATWTGLTIDKGVILSGNGIGNTLITLNGCTFNRNSTSSLILEDMRLTYASAQTYINGSPGDELFIIRDSELRSDTQFFRVVGNGILIHSSTIRYNSGSSTLGSALFQIKEPGNLSSWRSNPTYGADDTTGKINCYFENNTILGGPPSGEYNGQAVLCDADDAGRVVIRYNTFNCSLINSHGAATSNTGLRHFEVYENDFNYGSYNDQINPLGHIWFRGGSGVIFNNSFENVTGSSWGDKPEIILDCRAAQTGTISGEGSIDPVYPITRQIGWGWDESVDEEVLEGVWIYDNTGTQVIGQQYSGNDSNGDDIYDKYIEPVVSFTAKPGYTAYTYPHPLR